MSVALVILAAGLGARYGGSKQLEAVGPGGATLMDYTIYDALRAGVERVVFVVRPDLLDAARRLLDPRYAGHLPVSYAVQSLDDRPVGRRKPWGTGHAVLCAEPQVAGPFVVANADDFYGPQSLAHAVGFLRETPHALNISVPTEHALIAFRLRDTLSRAGPVSRAICTVDAAGFLTSITERTGIVPDGADAVAEREAFGSACDEREHLAGNTLVSMNLWAFRPAIFESLRRAFECFLAKRGDDPAAEFYLPHGIQAAIDAGVARVRVLSTSDRWCGLTAAADRTDVEDLLRAHVACGAYPAALWPRATT